MKPRVLIGPAPMRDIPHTYQPDLEAAGFEIVYPQRKAQMTGPELLAQLPGCRASLAGSEDYTPEVIATAAAAGLKVIARAGVGYDGVDVDAATANNIVVTYAPGSNHEAVAEHALMVMLALSKNLLWQHHEMKSGRWPRIAQQPLRERTLGIIGLGRTGKALALRALACRMKVMASDPYVDGSWAHAHGVTLTGQEELLRTADIVSLHVPLTPETHNLIRAETIKLMKPTAFLVNTSRGPVVQERDLATALREKQIAAAALDVFVQEPLRDSPLLELDNILLTAHTAGVDVRSREDMAHFAALAIVKLLHEKIWPEEWVVNGEVRDRWTQANW